MLKIERYVDQVGRWPQSGRHILAHFDEDTIIVYQAYGPAIGSFVLRHGYFGGDFKYTRMSWIKPNFLWMMYRSGWGMKAGQEITLALRTRRSFFDRLVSDAVESTYSGNRYASREAWQDAIARSTVRLQWDPDRDPAGAPLERRAVQLGLRGDALEAFGKSELLEVLDLSTFVAEQRVNTAVERISRLMMPVENAYRPCGEAGFLE